MSTRAEATFDIDDWQEAAYDEADGTKLSRTRVTKTFQGDVQGQSTAELLMAVARAGSMAYVSFERIIGSVHGRAGSFILEHVASSAGDTPSATWRVMPSSGTGDLSTIRGAAFIGGQPGERHTFTLDYELD
jgi:hypothetical protein